MVESDIFSICPLVDYDDRYTNGCCFSKTLRTWYTR